MKKNIKIGLLVLIAVALLGGGIWYMQKPLDVHTLRIQKSDLAETFEEKGDFVGAEVFRLAPEVPGKVLFVADENQAVKKGELLLEVENKTLDYQAGDLQGKLQSLQGQRALASPKLYEAQIQLQKLAIDNAQEVLKTLEKSTEDMQSLYDSGAIAKKELDDLKERNEQAKRQVEAEKGKLKLLQEQSQTPEGTKQLYDGQEKSLKENLAQIQHQQEKQKVLSPVDGIVTWRGIQPGEGSLPGQAAVEVTDLGDLHLETWVRTEDALNLQEGDSVKIRQEGSDEDRLGMGKVLGIHQFAEKKISPLGLEENRVKVKVKVTDKGDIKQQLRYSAKLTFTIREEKEALAVPKGALFPLNAEEDALWVVKDGKAHIQQVKKGFATVSQVQILEGLQEGDLVITDPGTLGLKEGKRVQSNEG